MLAAAVAAQMVVLLEKPEAQEVLVEAALVATQHPQARLWRELQTPAAVVAVAPELPQQITQGKQAAPAS